jgi:hypothetical protein
LINCYYGFDYGYFKRRSYIFPIKLVLIELDFSYWLFSVPDWVYIFIRFTVQVSGGYFALLIQWCYCAFEFGLFVRYFQLEFEFAYYIIRKAFWSLELYTIVLAATARCWPPLSAVLDSNATIPEIRSAEVGAPESI